MSEALHSLGHVMHSIFCSSPTRISRIRHVRRVQLAVLKEEKRKLLLLQRAEEAERNKLKLEQLDYNNSSVNGPRTSTPYHNNIKCGYCLTSKYTQGHNGNLTVEPVGSYEDSIRKRSNSLSESAPVAPSFSWAKSNTPEPKPIKLNVRDKGVACSVVTREVGVSHQRPKMRHAYTSTRSMWKQLGFSKVFTDNYLPNPVTSDLASDQVAFTNRAKALEPGLPQSSANQAMCYELFQTPNLNKMPLVSVPESINVTHHSMKNMAVNTDLRMNYVYTEEDLDISVAKAVKLHEKYYLDKMPEVTNSQSQPVSNIGKPVLQIVERSELGIQVDLGPSRSSASIQYDASLWQHDVEVQCEADLLGLEVAIQKDDVEIQTDQATWQKDKMVQYDAAQFQKDSAIQVEAPLKLCSDVGVTVKPRCSNAAVEVKTFMVDRGCSDCTINDILCEKCKVKKCSVGVGHNFVNSQIPASETSRDGPLFCSLSSLGEWENKAVSSSLKESKNKTVTVDAGCGTVAVKSASKTTDTLDLAVRTCEIAVNTLKRKFTDASVGSCLEIQHPCVNGEVNTCSVCNEMNNVSRDNVPISKTSHTLVSRIPRLNMPSPVSLQTLSTSTPHASNTKQSVQYDNVTSSASSMSTTFSYGTVHSVSQRSASNSSVSTNVSKKQMAPSPVEDAQEENSEGEESVTMDKQHRLKRQNTYTKLPEVSEDLISTSMDEESDRKTKWAEPSKEMKAAMKVINDYLTKSPTKKELPHHLTNAANIVKQEWFKVSGGKTVNPLAVEDYLDYIEGCSSALLEHVVNMTDISGNTALHYAVSSGNFDVVSILLDSKVCNINKFNAAGYTCVMLATLVKLRSETHRQIIRRMFHLADVNIKAKQHGQTALMLATSHGSLEMVEMLTEAGADMNIQDADGSTALMCAADHGFTDLVKHIISQPDCDVSITDSDGSSALNIAMESGNRNIGLLLYAHEHFSRGSSPHTSLRHRRSRSSTPTPTPKCSSLAAGRSPTSPVTAREQPDKAL